MTPMEVAARLAKEDAAKRTGIPYETGSAPSSFALPREGDGDEAAPSRKEIVGGRRHRRLRDLQGSDEAARQGQRETKRAFTGRPARGMGWGYLTGESQGHRLSFHPFHRRHTEAMSIFEEIERGGLKDVDFIEVQACEGGCVGGPLNIQNLFVARVNLKNMVNKYKTKDAYFDEEELTRFYGQEISGPPSPYCPGPSWCSTEMYPRHLVKMERLDAITATLPGLDCGACGSPNCRALAEDIIRGLAFDTDCIVEVAGTGEDPRRGDTRSREEVAPRQWLTALQKKKRLRLKRKTAGEKHDGS